MLIRKLAGAAAATFIVGVMAVAQASNQSPTAQQRKAAKAEAKTEMTVVGCLIKEADYRKAHDLGKGGLGGMRTGSDFVLVDAKTVAAGESATAPAGVAAGASCSEQGTGQAYRMAGKAEGALKPLANHFVVITGRFEHAHDAEAAAGERSAHLPPEIVIATYREAPVAVAAAATTTETPAPAPAPPATTAPAPATTAPAPVATTGEAAPPTTTAPKMPKTASDQPLIMLIAMLCLSASFGLRFLRQRAF